MKIKNLLYFSSIVLGLLFPSQASFAQSSIQELPDGNYLYGQVSSSNQIGERYIVFQKTGSFVVGLQYLRNSSDGSCFQGTVRGNTIPDAAIAYDTDPEGTYNIELSMGEIDFSDYPYPLNEPDNQVNARDSIQECQRIFAENLNDSESNEGRSQVLLDLQGMLDNNDSTLDDGSYYDSYEFTGQAGQSITISLESEDFDTYLILLDADRKAIAENDDLGDDITHSQVTVILPEDSTYTVIVNSYDATGQGRYILKAIAAE